MSYWGLCNDDHANLATIVTIDQMKHVYHHYTSKKTIF